MSSYCVNKQTGNIARTLKKGCNALGILKKRTIKEKERKKEGKDGHTVGMVLLK